jgi:hypothetical protein
LIGINGSQATASHFFNLIQNSGGIYGKNIRNNQT